MEGNNTFEKGLHRSNTPQMQPEGSYVDALNWIRNDSGRLVNEELEEMAQSLTDGTYELLGYCPIQDSFICFFKQNTLYSEIGIFDNITKQYRRVFNDFFATYRLNFSGEIDSTAKINASGDTIVYFVEKDNKPRRFNITAFEKLGANAYTNDLYNSEKDWNLQLDFKMPYANYSVKKGGALPSGVYSFTFRYATNENNKTTFNIPSRFISIPGYIESNQNGDIIPNDETLGALPQSPSNLNIEISMQNVDTNYPYIEPVVISYLGLTNTISIRSLGLFSNVPNQKIIFSDDSQYVGSAISETELLSSPVFINSAKSIEQKDNILILSNITSKKYDKDFQKIANAIELYWYVEEKPVDNRRNFVKVPTNGINTFGNFLNLNTDDIKEGYTTKGFFPWAVTISGKDSYTDDEKLYYHNLGTGPVNWPITDEFGGHPNGNSPFYSEESNGIKRFEIYRQAYSRDVVEANFQQSNVYGDPLLLKGFQRGEVYSFSITPIYKDGSVGFSYHIPGKNWGSNKPANGIAYWPSGTNYPDSYQSSDPLVDLRGSIRHHKMPDYDETGYIGSEYNIRILRVEARNINFTQEQLNNIQGYIIGYQPRVDELTTSVIDNGFAKPYVLRNGGSFPTKYQPSIFTGPEVIKYSSNGNDQNTAVWDSNFFNNNKYAMYYSPDHSLDKSKIKAGYKIQRVGYAANLILAKNTQPVALWNPVINPTTNQVTRAAGTPSAREDSFLWSIYQTSKKSIYSDSDYRLSFYPFLISKTNSDNNGNPWFNFFFETNHYYPQFGGLKNIQKAVVIPNLSTQPSDNQTTKPEIDVVAYGCSEYLHLTIEGQQGNSLFFDASVDSLPIQYKYIVPFISVLNSGNFWNRFSFIAPRKFTENGGNTHTPGDFRSSPKIQLTRIVNQLSSQYGFLEQANYTPCAVRYDDQNLNSNITLEGDVYISKVFQKILNTSRAFDHADRQITMHSIFGYYVESKNNYSLRHQEDGKVPFYPKYKNLVSASGTGGIFNFDWWKETVSYNKQYSSLSGLRLTFPKPLFFNENTDFFNRSVYSSQSFESELVDQYRIFPSLNFHDVPRHRGIITDTFVFNNNFYHHTEYGLWLSYFNPNTTQATSQGQVILGNAGVFQLPSKLVLDIKGGYMGTFDKSGTNTPFGRVFLDHKQGKIFLLTGEAPVEISDLGLFSFFRDFINTNDKYTMGYDWANKRLLINNISKERAISYYPKTQTWTSFHDFSPKAYFTTNGYSYAWKDNSFYNLNNQADTRKNSYITFVENTVPDVFKRFDRIEMNTMSGGKNTTGSPGFVEPNDYVFLDKSFTHIHAWTDRQNTTELPFAYSHDYNTNFLASYETDKVPVNYYRSSFHAELPLDAVIDPYKNIFDNRPLPTGNLDINADFRAHMKGKFLYTKLSYNDSKPLVLNYIKTFFKPTVA